MRVAHQQDVRCGPSVIASRELQEGIGDDAKSRGYLGEARLFLKCLVVKAFVDVGRDLVSGLTIDDEDHEVETRFFTSKDLRKLIQNGPINDARLIAAFCMSGAVSAALNFPCSWPVMALPRHDVGGNSPSIARGL